jgi:signal transduction histidine kinase
VSGSGGDREAGIVPSVRRYGFAPGALDLRTRLERLRAEFTAHSWRAAPAYLAAYVALEWASLIHEYKGVPVTPWNPGLGVLFASMVLIGPSYGLVLFAGVLVVEYFIIDSQLGWPVITGIGATYSLVYAALAFVARRRFSLDSGLAHLRDVFVLTGLAVAGAAVVAAVLASLLVANGPLGLDEVTDAVIQLLVGDILGVTVVTPVIMRFVLRWRHLPPAQLRVLALEGVVYLIIVALALWVIVSTERLNEFKYFYLLFLPVVVAAARHAIDGACLALMATQLALVAAVHRIGYDADAFTDFQTLMFVLTLTGLVVGVVVSERRRSDLAYREATERLKDKEAEANRAARFHLLSGMTSALAHEINQPMAAARALARSAQELLRMPSGDHRRAEVNLGAAIGQIDHAGEIVRRMREFLRRGQPRYSTVLVHDVLEDALTLVRPAAAARRIAIDLELPQELPLLHADRIQLEQVILNLTQNALDSIEQCGRRDGRVRISAAAMSEPPNVEFSVADNGSGIDPALAGALFSPLTTSKKDGLGLGLATCAAILEAHGGRVWLQSGQPGATEFRFTLPYERASR